MWFDSYSTLPAKEMEHPIRCSFSLADTGGHTHSFRNRGAQVCVSKPGESTKLVLYVFNKLTILRAYCFEMPFIFEREFLSRYCFSAKRNLIRTQFGLGYFLYVKSFRKGFFSFYSIQEHAVVPKLNFSSFYVVVISKEIEII